MRGSGGGNSGRCQVAALVGERNIREIEGLRLGRSLRPTRGGGALRGDLAMLLGISMNFVKTLIYPAGWVADKTGVRERAEGERPNEDLGAQGGAPPS